MIQLIAGFLLRELTNPHHWRLETDELDEMFSIVKNLVDY